MKKSKGIIPFPLCHATTTAWFSAHSISPKILSGRKCVGIYPDTSFYPVFFNVSYCYSTDFIYKNMVIYTGM